jgi:hypothetical protein
VDRHQYADAQEQCHQGGTAIAHEGQRDADHGQDAAHHAHVDEGVGEETERDGAGQQAREQGRCRGGDDQAAPDEQGVEEDQQTIAEQAPFFGKNREDEVGVFFRDELEVGLGAVQVALAESAAGADGDGRLDDVVAGTERIGGGVDQGQDARRSCRR